MTTDLMGSFSFYYMPSIFFPQEEIFIKKKKKNEFYLFQPFSVPRTFSILELLPSFQRALGLGCGDALRG